MATDPEEPVVVFKRSPKIRRLKRDRRYYKADVPEERRKKARRKEERRK